MVLREPGFLISFGYSKSYIISTAVYHTPTCTNMKQSVIIIVDNDNLINMESSSITNEAVVAVLPGVISMKFMLN